MKRILLLMVAFLMLCSCVRTPRLVIIHTNDVHSHFEAFLSDDGKWHGGIIERAAFIDSVRKAEGADRVLYLHGGDFSQGSSYFIEFNGDLEVEEQNVLGCDCVTLGNHELDNGIEDLARRLSSLRCPMVCANVDFSPFEAGKYIKPFVVLQRGGMKIGIIGLAPDLATKVSKTISSRLQQYDPVEVVNKYAAVLRAEHCDLVILLSHAGYEEDQKIVAASRGLDLVIGGHSHTFVEDFIYVEDLDGKKIPITQDGCWGYEMGKVAVY